jgi:hypothetical protein
MKSNKFLILALLAGILLLTAPFATALQPVPNESGFSGFFRPGVGYMRYKSNMVASFLGFKLSKRSTDSLYNTPDSESQGIVLLPWALRYTFASTRTQVFLGSEITDLLRFDYSQQLGVKQEVGSFGILQAGLLFSSIPAKVWADPYVANQDRDKAKRKSMGFRLVWDRIVDTDLQLQYTYRNIDIDNERSGQAFGLSPGQRELLKRDGDSHSLEVLYRFTLAEKHRLTPAFTYTYDDRDGSAMKSDVYDFQFTYGYNEDPVTLVLNAFIGWADYDKENPIYLKKQEDDRFGINGQVYYKNPWGWTLLGSDPMRFFVSTAYMDIDSNINFYDQQAFITTVGVGWTW